MSSIKSIFLFSFITILSISCKKDNQNQAGNYSSNLPNYGNVDVKSVFSEADSQVQNEGFVQSFLDQYYTSVWENGDLWGGILVAKGDKILLEKYRGFSQDGKQGPIDDKTPMHVASISKTLTAMAVLKLVETKKINLDDHVTKFFPGFPYPKVTVKTLLNQRSGLPKYEYFLSQLNPRPMTLDKKFLTNQDILDLLIQFKPELARDTDTGFMYCNTNYAMLALILEKVTKTKFPEAMQEMIFKPLKMEHTYIFQEKDTAKAAKSFYARGPRVYPYDQLDLIYGDKNVFTTPRDLFTFSKAMFSKDFLTPDLKKQIFTPYSNEKPGVNNYGLGFRMKIFDDQRKLTYHNGWWHGSNTVFAHLLDSKVTIIAIGNKYSNRVYSALALSALFEDYPFEREKLQKTIQGADSTNLDTTNAASNGMYSE